jgi:hypothetical protein
MVRAVAGSVAIRYTLDMTARVHDHGQIAAFLFWDEPHAVHPFALIIQGVLPLGVQVDRAAGAVHEFAIADHDIPLPLGLSSPPLNQR